jgi:hypothetical protein
MTLHEGEVTLKVVDTYPESATNASTMKCSGLADCAVRTEAIRDLI